MTDAQTSAVADDLDQERIDIIEALRSHRNFLRHTVEGLDDQAAAKRTTVSELCLGGLIKHVAQVEEGWVRFIQYWPRAIAGVDEAAMAARADGFRMLDGETVAGLLDRYQEVADRTDELV